MIAAIRTPFTITSAEQARARYGGNAVEKMVEEMRDQHNEERGSWIAAGYQLADPKLIEYDAGRDAYQAEFLSLVLGEPKDTR